MKAGSGEAAKAGVLGSEEADVQSATPDLKVVPKSSRRRSSRRAEASSDQNFRDAVIGQILRMVGEDQKAEALSSERVAEVLPEKPGTITYQDLNEVLMLYGFGTVSHAFFSNFFGDGLQTIDSIRAGVDKVLQYSLLFHGNFRRGFDELRQATERSVFERTPWDLPPVASRGDVTDRIVPPNAKEAAAMGYLIQDHGLRPQEVGKARKKGIANAERYMAMNGVDVYVAGSMRALVDFEEADELVTSIRRSTKAGGLGLTFFNPLWAYVDDSQQKGLLEVLMLKKASVMLFMAGTKDSFGKDSELPTMLVQGKPAIIYVPQPEQSDSRRGDFDRHFDMYRQHPLRMQCDLDTGVANGAIVVRDVKTCSEILRRLFTNTMEFEIVSDEHNHYLRERLTESAVRVITRNRLLTASFWQQYFGDDPRRL